MRLDTHVHTSPGSRCSQLGVDEYLTAIAEAGLRAACVTNHGNMADFDALLARAPAGLAVIPGVEISSQYGDFLMFSTDYDFLRTLEALQDLPAEADRPGETAVVWAHPFAGLGGGLAPEEFIAHVAAMVDGIEVYNGNWPDDAASAKASAVADRYGLAQLGGSDTHRAGQLLRCYTEVREEVTGAAALVEAIRAHRTRAVKK